MLKMYKYLATILLLTRSIWVFAGGDTASMRHFNIENGLPSNNVYSIIQDNTGYIWFTTDNGLVEYNGYTLKTFNSSQGLPSNDIWRLYPDKLGRLWVHAHAYKIGYIQNDQYKAVISSPDKIAHPSDIISDSTNVYFFYYDNHGQKVAIIGPKDSVRLIEPHISKTYKESSVIGTDRSLWMLTDSDNTLYRQNLPAGDKNYKPVTKLQFDVRKFLVNANGFMHFHHFILESGIFHNHIQIIDTRYGTLRSVHFNLLGMEPDEKLYTWYTAGDSLTLITNRSILVFDTNMSIIRRIYTSSTIPNSLQATYYTGDNQGNQWYATTSDGVWESIRATGLLHMNDSLSVLTNSKCVGIFKNGDTYWWNNKLETLYKLNSAQQIKSVPMPPRLMVKYIAEKNDSEMYICMNRGLYVFNKLTKRCVDIVQYLDLQNIKIYNPTVNNKAAEIYSDTLAIRSEFRHIVWLKQLDNKQILFYNYNPNLELSVLEDHSIHVFRKESDRYTSIEYDSTDKVYIFYNVNKLALYYPETQKYIILTPYFLNSVKINTILGVTTDKYSNVYLLDNNKLVIYNFKTNKIRRIFCNFAMTDAYIKAYRNTLIIAGKFGMAFANINGPSSISRFKVAINYKGYNKLNDLVVNNYGVVYLNTDKGIISLNTSIASSSELLNLANANFYKLVLSSPYKRAIQDNDTIVITQTNPKINLDAINFLGAGNPQYSYLISDYNNNWQESTTGELYINDLKPQHYYKIRCTIRDNLWRSKQIVFYLYIPPYWWQNSSWQIVFGILTSILIASILLGVILLTRHFVARANEKKRMLTELELRALYAQINPHFVFNTLSAILYFINNKKFDDAYTHVNKFSRLMRAYLKSSQDRYITLAEEIDMLKNYIELQRTRFEDKFDFKIEIDNKIPTKNIQIPSLLLQPLVENAINHGLFHKKENGLLILKFMQGERNSELICIIDDNGVGREKAREIKRSSTSKKESYGTKLTKQLIDIFREFERMDIILEYVDKQAPETGTTVILKIKNIKYVA